MTVPTHAPQHRILQGDLLDFTADPGFAAPQEAAGVRWRPDHRVLIDQGCIQQVLAPGEALPEGWQGVAVEA